MTKLTDTHRFSVAPMMDWTDRHNRFFLRTLSRKARLYTEMVTTQAILHGDRERLLGFDVAEHPVALQLGGSNPAELATCSKIGQSWGYDEINLNVGCPSDRVQSGEFGACLMLSPTRVADCVKAMIDSVDIPVTVKCRTGVDDQDSQQQLLDFIDRVASSGCDTFIIHARKAWLSGLSPKENREIPPLEYDRVYQIKAAFPELNISINGGISSLDDCESHLKSVDGVMLGRAAYQNPWLLHEVDSRLFGLENPVSTRRQVIEFILPYIDQYLSSGGRLQHIARHILGLYQNVPGARIYRRHISQNAHKSGATKDVIITAMELAEKEIERMADLELNR